MCRDYHAITDGEAAASELEPYAKNRIASREPPLRIAGFAAWRLQSRLRDG